IPLLFAPRSSRLNMVVNDNDQSACRRRSGNTHGRRAHRVDLLPFPQHVDDPEHVHHASDELCILRVLASLRICAAAKFLSQVSNVHAGEGGCFLPDLPGRLPWTLFLCVWCTKPKRKRAHEDHQALYHLSGAAHAVLSIEMAESSWSAALGPGRTTIGQFGGCGGGG